MGMTCGISYFALTAGFAVYDKQLYEKSLQELEFFAARVNDKMAEIEKLSYSLALDSDVQQTLAQMTEEEYLSNEYYYEFYTIRKIVFDEIRRNWNVLYPKIEYSRRNKKDYKNRFTIDVFYNTFRSEK